MESFELGAKRPTSEAELARTLVNLQCNSMAEALACGPPAPGDGRLDGRRGSWRSQSTLSKSAGGPGADNGQLDVALRAEDSATDQAKHADTLARLHIPIQNVGDPVANFFHVSSGRSILQKAKQKAKQT